MRTLLTSLVLLSLTSIAFGQSPAKFVGDGTDWGQIPFSRQHGYVEGVHDGIFMGMMMFMQSGDGDCGPGHAKKSDMTRYYCAISEIYYRIPSGLDSSKVTDEVSRFYADPRNVPVRWEAAVVISEAMLSGTKVTDEDLDTIRSYDAKATASLKQ